MNIVSNFPREVIVEVDKGIKLIITGYYTKSEPEVGLTSSFDIDQIESMDKDLYEIFDWVSANSNDYLEIIEDLCIKQIEDGDKS